MNPRLAVAVAALVLAGCLPAPYGTYYRPAYPDPSAEVTRASCGGQAGPPARLAFNAPPGLKFTASALKAPIGGGAHWPLAIAFALPPGHTFRFTADTIELATDATGPGVAVAPSVHAHVTLRLPADRWIDAATLAPADPVLRRPTDRPLGTVRIGFGRFDMITEAIEVTLPAIETERGRVTIPPLRLDMDRRRWGTRYYRTAEYLQSVIARTEACTREGRQRCENIRDFDAYAFRIPAGDFELVGRFWAMETTKRVDPLMFELVIEARGTERWRIVEPVVRVRDLAGGPVQEHRFTELGAAFHAPVPLSAPIRSARTGRATETHVRIDANLGSEERSRYFVRLPPYMFDGERYELKPIELELRRFDGGIEPFNC